MNRRVHREMAHYPLPKSTDLDARTICDLGSTVGDLLSTGEVDLSADEALNKLEKAVEWLGGEIVRMNFAELILQEMRVGSIEIHGVGDFQIFLPQEYEIGPIAARETIAHEIGHYILHHPMVESGTLRANHRGDSAEQVAAEKEATCFAEGFLVPTNSLRELNKTIREPKELARKFNVSEQTIINRLRLLSIGKE